MNYPLARKDHVVSENMASESVIYDGRKKKAHNLNSTLSWIWQRCDGRTSLDDMALAYEREFETENGLPAVVSGVMKLEASDLLEGPVDYPEMPVEAASGVSRRTILAGSAVVLPAILSVAAPTAAAAKSRPDADDPHGPPNGPGPGHPHFPPPPPPPPPHGHR